MGKTFKDNPENKKKKSKPSSKKYKLKNILDEEYLEEAKQYKR